MKKAHVKLIHCTLLLMLYTGCGSELNTSSDTSACFYCHSSADLTETFPTASSSPQEHMLFYGSGVESGPSYDPTATASFTIEWIKRGYHDEESLRDCSPCHNTLEDNEHGGFFYPAYSREQFYSPAGCANACHKWLYCTSWDPAVLLSESGNPHGDLFRRGYEGNTRSIMLAEIKPGCGGCHSVAEVRHGAIPGCLDCHDFYTGSNTDEHSLHLERLADDNSPCTWCHGGYGGTKYKAACYNCHESGHNPRAINH